eukprot:m.390913 g.390913  ORF g.390913 m.390913 type:complete len:73 (-) comp16757_c1_seq15:814-1032(-)
MRSAPATKDASSSHHTSLTESAEVRTHVKNLTHFTVGKFAESSALHFNEEEDSQWAWTKPNPDYPVRLACRE